MKNGKKPTYEQRKLIAKWGLDTREWLVVKDTPHEMVVVRKCSDNTTQTLPKGERA